MVNSDFPTDCTKGEEQNNSLVQAEQQTFVEKGEGIPRNDEINQHCLAN